MGRLLMIVMVTQFVLSEKILTDLINPSNAYSTKTYLTAAKQ